MPLTPMNDRTEKSFTQWLISIEKEKLSGELDLIKLEPRQIFETDEPDPEDEKPDVVQELDADGFFISF